MIARLLGTFVALIVGANGALGQSSPLTPRKGGTNSHFVGFTGPATSVKTFTLPNASETLAALGQIQTWTGAQSYSDGKLILLGSSSGAGTLKAPAAASTYVWTLPAATGTLAYLGNKLSDFSATSSAELRSILSDESGTGVAYFQGGNIGTPSAGVATNLAGTAAGLTAGNVTTNANLTGDVTSVGNATTLTNAPVIAKVLTGFASSTGTVTAAELILTAIQKLHGNDALKAPLASPALTGTPTAPTAAGSDNSTTIATTAYVDNQVAGSVAGVVSIDGASGIFTTANGIKSTSNVIQRDNRGFSAHKNATDQTGIANSTPTKISYTTELFDLGSYYDAANSKWTPPAGLVQISAALRFTAGVTDGGDVIIQVWKNGSLFRSGYDYASGAGSGAATISVTDQANGTDFYEIYTVVVGTTMTVNGATANRWFTGVVL